MSEFSNVLVVSGGKWVGMVLQLKRAMREVPDLRAGRILVADKATITPAGYFADGSVVVPPISHQAYVDELLEICERHKIRVLVPIIDLDVQRLSGHIDRFSRKGTAVVCPPTDIAALCFDKSLFALFAFEYGLDFPKTYTPEQLDSADYPLFYKRRAGFGSIGCGGCNSPREARMVAEGGHDVIFQEYISAPEVSIDAYIAASGVCTVRVPRVRDKVVGGEAYHSHTIRLGLAQDLADRTIGALAKRGLRGPLNIQMFLGERPRLVEVNTRLGSASVLSNIASGGRLFHSVLDEACGGRSEGDPDDYVENMSLYRFLGDVFYQNDEFITVIPDQLN